MSTIAELLIKLSMDDAGLDKGMSGSQSKLNSWGASLRSVGTKLTAGVTLPLAAAGAAALNWASDQQEAANKVDVVFGNSAQGVKDWAESTSGSLLLSTGDAMEAAGTFGNLFTSMGMGQEDAAGLSTELVELAQDLSSFNNVPTDQALVALRAALVGEYEPMRALGVQLSQATVEQKALEMGIWDGNGALTAQQRVLATNALIMEQTTNAQGDAARTANSFANRLRILKANLRDAGAELGMRLLPYAERFLGFLLDLLDRFDALDPKWQTAILAIAAFAAALGPVLIAIGMMLPALGLLGTVIGFLVSPIGLVVVALAALIGLGIYAFINDLWGVRDAVYAVIDALSVFKPMLGDLYDAFQALKEGDFAEVWDELKEAAVSALQGIAELAGRAMDALRNIDWASVFQGGLDILNSVISAIRNIDWGSLIQGGWDILYSGLQLAWEAVKDIPWESIIGKIADFGTWLSGKVSSVDWGAIIGKIADFDIWLSAKVGQVVWGDLIGKIADFAAWLGEKVSDVDWVELIGEIVDFSVWLSAKVGQVLWEDLIGKIDDFAAWLSAKIPDVTWDTFIPDIEWSDFIPKLSWPSKDDILDAILGRGDDGAMAPGDPNAPWNQASRYEPQRSYTSAEGAGGAFNNGTLITTLPAVGSGPQGFFDKLQGVAQQVAATIAQMATAIQSGLQQITTSFQTTTQQVGSLLQQLQVRVQQTFQQIAMQATTSTNQLRSVVTVAWQQITQAVSMQAQSMQQRVAQVFQQMQSQASASLAQLQSRVQSAMQQTAAAAQSGMAQFSSAVQSGMQRAVSATQAGVSQIRGIVSGLNLSGQGYSIGASLGQGIASGIQAYIGTVAAAAAALVSAAIAAAQSAAAAHSPSRKMMALGGDMAEGLTIGLERGAASVADATAALVNIPSGAMGATGATGNTYVSIALKSQELIDLIRNAEDGGEFSRNFGQQMGLYAGIP